MCVCLCIRTYTHLPRAIYNFTLIPGSIRKGEFPGSIWLPLNPLSRKLAPILPLAPAPAMPPPSHPLPRVLCSILEELGPVYESLWGLGWWGGLRGGRRRGLGAGGVGRGRPGRRGGGGGFRRGLTALGLVFALNRQIGWLGRGFGSCGTVKPELLGFLLEKPRVVLVVLRQHSLRQLLEELVAAVGKGECGHGPRVGGFPYARRAHDAEVPLKRAHKRVALGAFEDSLVPKRSRSA